MNAVVYSAGWTLDDVDWAKFDPTRVDPGLLAAVKGACLVEYNAPDYVGYLARVFQHSGSAMQDALAQWGHEEVQHGLALGRWAELADPNFRFQEAFARFRAGFKPPHFAGNSTQSVRGSRRGEMIARCVVESGTSSFYSAIRDATEEPVLKELAGRIAADEFRHYRLFLESIDLQDEPDPPFWRKLLVAISRVNESDDDELAFAYYCGNVPAAQEAAVPYNRLQFARAYNAKAMSLYRRHHITKLVQMVAKSVGADPQGRVTGAASSLLWNVLRLRAGHAASRLPAAAA
jgi:hypothetical protein